MEKFEVKSNRNAEISVYEPEQRYYEETMRPAQINWPALGAVDVAEAKAFVNAMQEAIEYAEALNVANAVN